MKEDTISLSHNLFYRILNNEVFTTADGESILSLQPGSEFSRHKDEVEKRALSYSGRRQEVIFLD